MAPNEPLKSARSSQDELAVISNRLAIAMAKREALVKSWTASSSRPEPEKTQEELDAEDAALFRNAPPHLGVGAAIPAHFLANESEGGKKALRAKLLSTKGLKASKARDAVEKAASAKRAMREQSSDEEEGRSSLGRAKKFKSRPKPVPVVVTKQDSATASESDEQSHQTKAKKRKIDVEEAEAPKEVSKAESENKEMSRVEKGRSIHSGNTKKDKKPAINSSEDSDAENDEPMKNIPSKGNQTESMVSKGMPGPFKREGVTASLQEDGMDAKERRRLKKKEKKRMKKLREKELAAKV